MHAYILFSLLLLMSCTSYSQRTEPEFYEMLEGMYKKTVPLIREQALNKEAMNNYILLDTREKEEYDVAHLKGAIWAGYDDFQEETVRNLPKDKPIIVYCSVGYRSERIGERLQEMGFIQVQNLYGGIFDWKNHDNPVVDKDGSPTEKVHTYNEKWGQWLLKGEKVY